jgi:cytochrome P450
VQNLERLRCEHLSGSSIQNSERVCSFSDNAPDRLLQSILVLASAIGQAPTAPSQKLYWKLTNLRPTIRKAHKDRQQILQMHIDRASQRVKQGGMEVRFHSAVDYMVTRELAMAEKVGRKPILDSPLFHDMLFGYCLGGQDTTHSVLSFLVKRLGVHQATQDKLRTYLHQAYAPALAQRRNPTQEEITKSHIPYLDAFIEEVLRCDTPSPFVIKETLVEMPILGAVVPKGSLLFLPLFGRSIDAPAYAIPESARSDTSQKHNNTIPSDWTGSEFAPHEFHAERWLRKDTTTGRVIFDPKAGPFMTFGAGNRECWGKRLAYLQLKLIATLLLWRFQFLPLSADLGGFETTDILNAKPKKCFVSLKVI